MTSALGDRRTLRRCRRGLPGARGVLVALVLIAASSTGAAPAHAAPKVSTKVVGWSTASVRLAADEELRRTVTVRTGARKTVRSVVLQFRAADARRWRALVVARSDRRGAAALRVRDVPASGWLRVKVPATRSARAAVTRRVALTVIDPPAVDPADPTDPAHPSDPTRPGWAPSAYEAEVLRLTNEVRAAGATCGSTAYGPKPPVTLSPELGRAARAYAQRMGEEGFFSHVSPSGDDPGDRAEEAGYAWSGYGENIAAGYRTPQDVVEGWRESPGHCRNLMGSFVHLGVGYADVTDSHYRSYWVQMFGSPRR